MSTSSHPDSQNPRPWPTPAPSLHDAIRRRAEEIYILSGSIPGRDLANWEQAEQEIGRKSEHSTRKAAIVVRVDGAEYVGEYSPESSNDYHPGEFGRGAPVPVRFYGDRMIVKRPNGRLLETTIVLKIV